MLLWPRAELSRSVKGTAEDNRRDSSAVSRASHRAVAVIGLSDPEMGEQVRAIWDGSARQVLGLKRPWHDLSGFEEVAFAHEFNDALAVSA